MPTSPSGVLRRLKLLQGDEGPAALLAEARKTADGDLRKGAELAETAVQLSRHQENPAALAECLTFLGQCLWKLSDNASARTVIREAAALYQSLGDDAGHASALNTDGNVSQLLGDYAGAIETHQRSLLLRRQLGDRAAEAASLNNLGTVFFELGDLSRSLDFHLQSLQIKAEIGDRQGEALSLGNIGTVYFELGDLPTALDYQRQSLALHQALGNRAGSAYPLGNLGELYLLMNDPAAALDCLQQALVIRRELGDRSGEALNLVTLGRIQHATGDIPAAMETLARSQHLAEEIGLIPAQINALIALGRVQLRDLPPNLRQRAEAWGSRGPVSLFEQALALAQQTGARQHMWEAHCGLALTHKQEGRIAEALAHFEQFHAIKEAILTEEAARRTDRMQTLSDLAADRREQAGQLQQGRELSRAHATLRQARKARRELHHAVTAGLREPLATLQGRISELIATGALPGSTRALAEAIRADATLALDRLQSIARAGLNVSQINRLHRSPVMLDALIAGVASLYEQQTEGDIRLISEPCPVEVDALLMVEAMDQILERALTLAAPGAGMRIVVRRETVTAAAFVSSTLGLPRDGGSPTTASDIAGLEAAREIIRRHGGDLSTAPGTVGEFTLRIFLPLQQLTIEKKSSR